MRCAQDAPAVCFGGYSLTMQGLPAACRLLRKSIFLTSFDSGWRNRRSWLDKAGFTLHAGASWRWARRVSSCGASWSARCCAEPSRQLPAPAWHSAPTCCTWRVTSSRCSYLCHPRPARQAPTWQTHIRSVLFARAAGNKSYPLSS